MLGDRLSEFRSVVRLGVWPELTEVGCDKDYSFAAFESCQRDFMM